MKTWLTLELIKTNLFLFFHLIGSLIAGICVIAVLIAVLIDFVEFQQRAQVKKEKKSIVETGSMLVFFFGFYFLLRFGIGKIELKPSLLAVSLIIIGLILLILGCLVNIYGRINLGKNWANQIKIYEDHTFIAKGAYAYLRHPLYASLIWMFFGASLLYFNYLAFLANLFIFIPFMYYRAKQEETLLSKEFPKYQTYQRKTGMFFPKIK